MRLLWIWIFLRPLSLHRLLVVAAAPAQSQKTMGCCFGKKDELPPAFDPTIGLSGKLKGPQVQVDGLTVSGTGSIMGDSPILQDKGYFEVTIQNVGPFAIGVATRDSPLDDVLSQEKSRTAWTLTSQQAGLPALPAGSTLGVALDQGDYPVQVYFYLDGKVRARDEGRSVARSAGRPRRRC